jgi:uncharacterized hydrophobic protein (TIGR00271 family)
MTEIGLEQQMPPHPEPAPDKDRFLARIPRHVTFRRLRARLRFLRIKFAKAVLLPQFTPDIAWDLRESVYRDSQLTRGYVLMTALSAGIATLGLLQSSTAVVIGAMLISPLMSPIAALGFGFASVHGDRIREAARVVAVGAAIGILTAVLITLISPIRNATPEILSRTQPTLLDLGVALFSGIAGGYATVIRKGETAIGVAIATALMPPLAVLGYAIGMLHVRFALGALLLFLTNLAAITFSFAVIARLSGAARPLFSIKWSPGQISFFVLAFLALAVPLSMSLIRLAQEASMRSAARTAITEISGGRSATIAQLEVSWPLFGEPSVDALVIAPTYSPNAERQAEERLAEMLGENVRIKLQQVQAADIEAQTRAMLDAAMERTAAGIAADAPPYDRIRASIGLPTNSIWINRAERLVHVEPVRAPGWTLADYAQTEIAARKVSNHWNVRIIPPPQAVLRVNLGDPETADEDTISPKLAGWALSRWGLKKVMIEAPAGKAAQDLASLLADEGITAVMQDPGAEPGAAPSEAQQAETIAVIRVYAMSPTRAAREAAEAAAAEEARKKAERERQAAEAPQG